MKRSQAYTIPLFTLLAGVGVGAFGGHRYAQNVAGKAANKPFNPIARDNARSEDLMFPVATHQ